MSSGGVESTPPGETRPAGGSESPFRREGQREPSGAGYPGETLTPSPRGHVRKHIDGIVASNKFVSVGWDSLQRDPNWTRQCYNRAIASWLRNCARTHDEICNCGQWRRHWFQECAGLEDASSQTEDPRAQEDLRRLRESGAAAKRKLDYIDRCKKRPKTVTWFDTGEEPDVPEGFFTPSEDEDGYDTDVDEDAVPGGVNFDMRVEDPFLNALRGGSTTRIQGPTW